MAEGKGEPSRGGFVSRVPSPHEGLVVEGGHVQASDQQVSGLGAFRFLAN